MQRAPRRGDTDEQRNADHLQLGAADCQHSRFVPGNGDENAKHPEQGHGASGAEGGNDSGEPVFHLIS